MTLPFAVPYIARRAALMLVLTLAACTMQSPVAPAPATDHFVDEHQAALHFIQPIFSVLDCEKKGEIEQGEVDEHFFELYFFADRDRSRSISAVEFAQSTPHSTPQQNLYLFQRMDTDRNELISVEEYRQFVFAALQVADTNQDGSVDEQEAAVHAFRRAGRQ